MSSARKTIEPNSSNKKLLNVIFNKNSVNQSKAKGTSKNNDTLNNSLNKKRNTMINTSKTNSNNKHNNEIKDFKSENRSSYFNNDTHRNNGNNNKDQDSQQLFKDMVEKADVFSKVDLFISDTIELLTTNTLAVGREDVEKYELIEKAIYQNMKITNNKLKDEEDALIEEYNKLVEEQNINYKELTTLNKKFANQETIKNNNMMAMNDIKLQIKEYLVSNEKLNLEIQNTLQQKENIYRTVMYLNSNLKRQLPKTLKDICNKANTERLKKSSNNFYSTKINFLTKKVESLEETLSKIKNNGKNELSNNINRPATFRKSNNNVQS